VSKINQYLKKLDGFFSDLFLKKAPQLSDKNRQAIAKATGWVALALGLLALPGILGSLGITRSMAPFWHMGGKIYARWIVNYLASIVQVVLMLIAVPQLFKMKVRGWQFVYWATLVGILSSIITFSGFGLVVSAVFLYLLYQIKKLYK
jgi:uncharacterized membrane protein